MGLRRLLGLDRQDLEIRFIKSGGWLAANLPHHISPPTRPIDAVIEKQARLTNSEGGRPLWEGYGDVADYPRSTEGDRTSDEVRTAALMGRFYAWLADMRGDPVIVEFGTAFGVSGMYWLSGVGQGHLHTFEPNADWATFAEPNLAVLGKAFTLTRGTFEEHGPRLLAPRSVDIGFIDAIHTGAFVDSQFAILRPLMKAGGIVLFDDINFSPDMAACWDRIAADPTLTASARLDDRVGIIELA